MGKSISHKGQCREWKRVVCKRGACVPCGWALDSQREYGWKNSLEADGGMALKFQAREPGFSLVGSGGILNGFELQHDVSRLRQH